jgi:aryl-alcohol dehydrogenase-like predicted oxidoreductase
LVEEVRRTEVPERVALAAWTIAWCLRHPAVSRVVAGSKSVQQLQAMRSGRPGPGRRRPS